jgi:hypothetical protein
MDVMVDALQEWCPTLVPLGNELYDRDLYTCMFIGWCRMIGQAPL